MISITQRCGECTDGKRLQCKQLVQAITGRVDMIDGSRPNLRPLIPASLRNRRSYCLRLASGVGKVDSRVLELLK